MSPKSYDKSVSVLGAISCQTGLPHPLGTQGITYLKGGIITSLSTRDEKRSNLDEYVAGWGVSPLISVKR
jgi:hypothetical protein